VARRATFHGRSSCPTRANRQPAAAGYLRRLDDSAYQAFVLTVLRIENGATAEITAFERLDLPPRSAFPKRSDRSRVEEIVC
jgi:RNA polymerase sigma-70 factor (ECF subfamily)